MEKAKEAYKKALSLCDEFDIETPKDSILNNLNKINEAIHIIPRKSELDTNKSHDNYFRLLEVLKDLNAEDNLNNLLEKVVDYSLELSGAVRGFLLIANDKKIGIPEFEVKVARNYEEHPTNKTPVSYTVVKKVFKSGKPIITIDAGHDEEFSALKSVLRLDLKSIICIAFTGADKNFDGLLLQADGETLFLDEIGETPLSMQVKLLRVIQENEVRQLGSNQVMPINVRFVSASNKSLEDMIHQKKFRQDLYFRLAALTVDLPPLRERKEDLPLLIQYLLNKITTQYKIEIKPCLTEAAFKKLLHYRWPGNVRELEHVLTNALVLNTDGSINADDINLMLEGSELAINSEKDILTLPFIEGQSWESYENQLLKLLVQNYDGNKTKAAKDLKLSRTTLFKKLKQ